MWNYIVEENAIVNEVAFGHVQWRGDGTGFVCGAGSLVSAMVIEGTMSQGSRREQMQEDTEYSEHMKTLRGRLSHSNVNEYPRS
ncbi:uncharacterized protein LACBIDRAFT_308141 [Laccaria bicolor S238N-H82]|uniref:Predicted protein n=1 Tax=Laccaria bicolor (strain S238N-H82 / ATCC MYA-4686) TaxID=486041 RepID=B0E241_LACBS|nr:uncharacterized protein LACBIDRAFT_317640 [Laccaria bicolor S238N-H82]XP_001891150.1 uncharacterized protein LACBIDRAFT_308141 [Laccaria bicolor S238N-H82]EDQ98199.1 predicted protein [Laccaria bicolor S238N-H82]EDQ99105.1 predicted protein [Laccaria bicolor S238N-H82]|eukprot:XP_001890238.1 predicted protein [Laccaria bicolor S238N-H82]